MLADATIDAIHGPDYSWRIQMNGRTLEPSEGRLSFSSKGDSLGWLA